MKVFLRDIDAMNESTDIVPLKMSGFKKEKEKQKMGASNHVSGEKKKKNGRR
jgi:hypothetical protein